MANITIQDLADSLFLKRLNELKACESRDYSLVNFWAIDLAEGENLDFIGNMVGQPRLNMVDSTYRLFLKGKIAANSSLGSIPEIELLLKLLTQDEDCYIISNNASITLYINADVAELIPYIEKLLTPALMAGVGIDSFIAEADGDFGFTDAGTDVAGVGTFGDLTDASVGGRFTYIL